jgi:hypothetical protein
VFHEGLLGHYGGSYRIPGPRERDEKRVPLRVNLLAVSFLKRGAEKRLVFGQNLRLPAVAEEFEQRRGPSMSVNRR